MEWTGTGLHLPFIYLLMMSILQVPRCGVLLFNRHQLQKSVFLWFYFIHYVKIFYL